MELGIKNPLLSVNEARKTSPELPAIVELPHLRQTISHPSHAVLTWTSGLSPSADENILHLGLRVLTSTPAWSQAEVTIPSLVPRHYLSYLDIGQETIKRPNADLQPPGRAVNSAVQKLSPFPCFCPRRILFQLYANQEIILPTPRNRL